MTRQLNPAAVSRLAFIAAVWCGMALLASAQDNWPQFRGPESNGVAKDSPSLPDHWSATENVVWKTDVPGMGWGSPIVWGKKIFVTTAVSEGEVEPPKPGLYFKGERPVPSDPHRWATYCIDMDSGKILWEKTAYRGVPPKSRHLKNSFASETPVTDGERVYAYFGNIGLFVYDMEGNEVWKKPFEAKNTRYGWGTAASPVLDEKNIYIVNDNDEEAYIVAYDKKTGKQVWRTDRKDEFSNWATPYLWKHDGRVEIVTPGSKAVRSYDTEGNLLWQFRGMSSIAIPTPFSYKGLLYIASGYVGDKVRPVYAVKPGASGDITLGEGQKSNDYIAWFNNQAGSYNPTPILYNDIFYVLLDRGFFTAYEAKDGTEIYGKQRIAEGATAFTSSPWAYNDKIFILSEDGDAFTIAAGREYKVLSTSSLGEMCMATPAIAGGSLIIRTASKVYRLQQK
ncbi:PQQ-like beta-propeller repeat protein [Candidatus Sumerlaeota bacterium]|nr:PQQ-like beta-propeller repeat protein [Candidatus Sumerlaeota bacterium]